MAAAQENMICVVCTEVYRSPRFLPCHHSFCLECLEQLAQRHGNVIPCPICRAPATVPAGGVRDLQVNFYFKEEELEQARSEARPSLCPVHAKESAIFYCIQCEEAICLRCKWTIHKGHNTEDLSKAASRCKKTIENKQIHIKNFIEHLTTKSKAFEQNEKRAKEKRKEVEAQIEHRYGVVVAMAAEHRDQALKELQEISDNLEKDLAADTQRVQDALDFLLHLQERAAQALSTACDTDVVQVEKDMARGPGSDECLRELEAGLPVMTCRLGLHGDFTNDIKDKIKRYIGSPVKLTFPFQEGNVDRLGKCDDGEYNEVHGLRQKKDTNIEVLFGGPGGDFSKEKSVEFVEFLVGGEFQLRKSEHGKQVSFVARTEYHRVWKDLDSRRFFAKGDRMFALRQNCKTGGTTIFAFTVKEEAGKAQILMQEFLIKPAANRVHNFDSAPSGFRFAVVDEDHKNAASLLGESESQSQEGMTKSGSRVVRIYSKVSNVPVQIYIPPQKVFFPTDVCFMNDILLLVADWMNDSIHMVQVIYNSASFIRYLSFSGDIVRPTALNLDLNGHLLIGCADGWVLKDCKTQWNNAVS